MLVARRRSLLLTLTLELGVALLPLLILVGLQWLPSSSPAPTADAARLASELDRLLQIRLRETFAVAAFPSIRAFVASSPETRSQRAAVALNELQAWVAADTPVREVLVLDRNASVTLTTGKDSGLTWTTRAFVVAALAGKLDVSPIAHDAGEYSQYFSAPILDNNGSVDGVLLARVSAQELWDPVNSAGDPVRGIFAVLVDENAVRLADGGDATRILQALAPLTSDEQARVVGEHTYGEQVTLVRATDLNGAAAAIRSGSPGTLTSRDLGAAGAAAQRLMTKPWTVLVISSNLVGPELLGRIALPLLAAVILSVLASLILSR